MSGFRRRSPAQLDEEIRHHIRERADELIEQGWSPTAALREAERRFGDVRRIRRTLAELHRDDDRPSAGDRLRSLVDDARYALRGIHDNRTFAVALVATLALGIGASSSIFAVIDALLLRPVPYRDADRWVETNRALRDGSYTPGARTDAVSVWQEATGDWLDAWIAFLPETLVRTDGPRAEALHAIAVTPGADTLLGIPLLLGRGFSAEDAHPGAPTVAILSRAYWQRAGADPQIVGTTLRLEGTVATVVGVLAGGIKFPELSDPPDLWVPFRDDFSYADREPARGVYGLWARMRPGLDLQAAQERTDAIGAALDREHPGDSSWRVHFEPVGAHRANRDVLRALLTLAATVAAIFLVALVNGVNLLLVRASGRAREIAVRRALGASRLRLFRQFVVEGLVLGTIGGVAAAALAWLAVAAMRGVLPPELTFFSPHPFTVEGRTLAFTFAAALFAGTVLGLVPALQVLHRDPSARLAGRQGDDASSAKRLRNGLVVAQVALSTCLLITAGLLVNSFVRLVTVDPGYEYGRLAIADLMLSSTRYAEGPARAELAARLRTALEEQPLVESVSLSTGTSFSSGAPLSADGETPPEQQPFLIPYSWVDVDYLSTTGIELVDGRWFDAADAGTRNVVIDAEMARFLWGERRAVGHTFQLEDRDPWTVVGVVRDLALMGRDQRRGPCQYLLPLDAARPGRFIEVRMRARGRPEALLPVFERTLRQLDPEQWTWKLQTGAQALAADEDKPRFVVTLMSLLAGIAVTLAAVGLYGVLAYSVARRGRELGIRIALGAGRARVRAMVLGQGVAIAGVGVVLGLLGAVYASRLVQELLYEVRPHDPATFGVTAALLVVVALAASAIPARRATRVDPVRVLRAE